MLKKILSVLLAAVMAFGILTVAVFAEDSSEPAEPEYVPVEHKIETIAAQIEAGHEYVLQPTDTIVLNLPETPAQPEEPTEPEEPAEPEDPDDEIEEPTETTVKGDVLIVEYYPGTDAASMAGKTKFVDMQKSGYAVRKIGDYTDYAYEKNTRGTDCAIDFQSNSGYKFVQWKVTSVYAGENFSKITVEAEWDEPALTGWAGYLAMKRAYIKMFIDYLIEYLTGLFDRVSSFLI